MNNRIITPPKNAHKLYGMTFGRLTVCEYAGNGHWICKCSCGVEKKVKANNLLSGDIRSCGCLKAEEMLTRFVTHGMTGTRALMRWSDMVYRCTKPYHHAWDRYGGRGITVCSRWCGKNGFASFMSDMGEPPADMKRPEIDRIDNNGPYSPENCRWATRKQQNRNNSRNKMLTYRGETKCLSEWCEVLNIPYGRTKLRLRNGMPVEDAFELPSMANR